MAYPGYGRITITRTGEELHWAYRGHVGVPRASSLRYVRAARGARPPATRPACHLIFHREGDIASLAVPFEPLVKDIVFTRIPAGDCTNPAFRQHCESR
jgi:hypothetical protein